MKVRYAIAALVLVAAVFIFFRVGPDAKRPEASASPIPSSVPVMGEPLSRATERIAKKSFGLYVSPGHSPVSPERFTGYHTGADFEILPGEDGSDVVINAICDGRLLQARAATGYGGVMVQSCGLGAQAVTVVYGHIRLSSVVAKAGDAVSRGQQLAVLVAGYSAETGNERKHLHLGIHKGLSIDMRGYVQKQVDLSGWLDPLAYIK